MFMFPRVRRRRRWTALKSKNILSSHLSVETSDSASAHCAQLYSKGEELFGTVSQFNKWLNKELYSLDNLIPLRLMSTVIGIDKVLDELYSIEFGTPA